MTTPKRLRGALLAAAFLSLLFAASAFAVVGGLTQKAGTAGCISELGTAGACVDGVALDQARVVAISPDGANAYVASQVSNGVAIFDRNPTTGSLTQKAGTAGCVTETGAGPCVDGTALAGPFSVAVSPDGASVYVASFAGNAVAIFDRNPATGALAQKAGTAGCISDDGSAGACVDGNALVQANTVTVSPDGKNVYVGSQANNSVTIFDRNTTTGALTQKAGTAGCIAGAAAAGCVLGNALLTPTGVTVSADGKSVYVASRGSGAVVVFDRNTTTGALTQKAGTAGCISDDGTAGACVDGVGLAGSSSVRLSPDGTSAYVAGKDSDAVAIFDRSTTTGALTQKPGVAGCVSETGTAGACVDGTGLDEPVSVEVTPDGASTYVTSTLSDAIAIFDRNATTGAITQKPGIAGCITETGSAGACADGTALDNVFSVAFSPNGANVYVATSISDAVVVFDRDLAPQTTIDSGPSGVTSDNTPSFGFSSSDAGSTFECSVDAGPFGACSGPGATHTTFALADGPHQFQVRAIDPATTPDPTAAVSNFTVDTTPPTPPDTTAPETTITKKPKAKLKTKKGTAKASVSFSSESGASFECRLDGDDFESCSSPFGVKAKSKGGKGKKHTIEVRATDAAGNVEAPPASVSFKVVRQR